MLADKAHTVKKRKIIVLFSLLIFFQNIANTFALGEFSSYEGLRSSWNEIFPDGNRNAAGAKFFKYILEKENNFEKLIRPSPTSAMEPSTAMSFT